MSEDPAVAIVAIGRNEGERLIACLASLGHSTLLPDRIIYVDSGSTDNSATEAEAWGAEVVQLDMSVPFTAARARNAGVAALEAKGELPDYIQFIDGDCRLVDGFLLAAVDHMRTHPELGIVTGWRAEMHPDASIYNMECHLEWRAPAGPIVACGGDMLVRTEAFHDVGGFNPDVIAAEDDDFCLRVGKAGWRLERLPLEMTQHDANIHRFGQWWKRCERAGHGFAQVDRIHPGHFRKSLLKVIFWSVIVPVCAVLYVPATLVLSLSLYALSFLRIFGRNVRQKISLTQSLKLSSLMVFSKFPNLIGAFRYFTREIAGRRMYIIEYK